MDTTQKKAVLLLKSLIFHFHGLDEEENKLLQKAASKMNGQEELEWANGFIAEDYLSAFERSREFLKKVFRQMREAERLQFLAESWEENHKKGYVTEMENTAMLTLSKDWKVDKEFMDAVKR